MSGRTRLLLGTLARTLVVLHTLAPAGRPHTILKIRWEWLCMEIPYSEHTKNR